MSIASPARIASLYSRKFYVNSHAVFKIFLSTRLFLATFDQIFRGQVAKKSVARTFLYNFQPDESVTVKYQDYYHLIELHRIKNLHLVSAN